MERLDGDCTNRKTDFLNDKIFISFVYNYYLIAKTRKREYSDAQKLITQILAETQK